MEGRVGERKAFGTGKKLQKRKYLERGNTAEKKIFGTEKS